MAEQQKRADTLTFTHEDYTAEKKGGKIRGETTQTQRGITKVYCVNTVSVAKTNIIEVN